LKWRKLHANKLLINGPNTHILNNAITSSITTFSVTLLLIPSIHSLSPYHLFHHILCHPITYSITTFTTFSVILSLIPSLHSLSPYHLFHHYIFCHPTTYSVTKFSVTLSLIPSLHSLSTPVVLSLQTRHHTVSLTLVSYYDLCVYGNYLIFLVSLIIILYFTTTFISNTSQWPSIVPSHSKHFYISLFPVLSSSLMYVLYVYLFI
jgi:hypothetical protein